MLIYKYFNFKNVYKKLLKDIVIYIYNNSFNNNNNSFNSNDSF